VALVVPEPGHDVTADQVREHLAPSFAKWQLPDTVLFVDMIPKTGVGKFDKKVMRADHADLYTEETVDE